MDTALPQKFPFILDRNLEKANCTENRVCTSCDIVVLGSYKLIYNITINYAVYGYVITYIYIYIYIYIFNIVNLSICAGLSICIQVAGWHLETSWRM